ncbi:MAG: cytochrome c3 family protein [Desulfoarculaceae bacterium]|nr:cytochrome c3 family protein [Desulfoarculaceae bacterium]
MNRNKAVALALALVLAVSAIAFVISARQQAHRFTSEECLLCHTQEKGGSGELRPDVTEACASCHPSAKSYQSHPTDLVPKNPLPGDMLLVNGRLTCVSCHDVHARNGRAGKDTFFLRRNVDGKSFCLICHDVTDKGHLFIGATHGCRFQVCDSSARVDPTTLLCIECHEDRIDSLDKGLGAENLGQISYREKHPVGLSYVDAYRRDPASYVPPDMLGDGIELYDGKIGCGTCHNRFAGENFMLVMRNERSRLCLSCHIK